MMSLLIESVSVDQVATDAVRHVWRRLDQAGFLERGLQLAAILLLSLVPFMIVVQSLAGTSAVSRLVVRFGLTDKASAAVSRVFTAPDATSGSIRGLSWLFVLWSGLTAAAAVQELYEHAFGLDRRGYRDLPRRLAWLGLLSAAALLGSVSQPWLRNVGGPLLVSAAVLLIATGFWWVTMRLLLGPRLGWGELLPSAVFTGLCWFGMDVAFRLTMSSTIVSNSEKYGAIGVVFALMSFLVAVGVVIILGAIAGLVWRERRAGSPGCDDAAAPTAA